MAFNQRGGCKLLLLSRSFTASLLMLYNFTSVFTFFWCHPCFPPVKYYWSGLFGKMYVFGAKYFIPYMIFLSICVVSIFCVQYWVKSKSRVYCSQTAEDISNLYFLVMSWMKSLHLLAWLCTNRSSSVE